MAKQVNPLKFYSLLRWLDGRPLLDVIEPYRQAIFTDTLFSLDGARPAFNLVLCGRGKKNWKSADLIFASLYRLLAWHSPNGNQCYVLANDGDQAADDLELAKKLIAVNPVLDEAVEVKQKLIERRDGKGFLEILPAQDVAGSHGKTYLFAGFDEIHGYKNWDILEAMQLDPTRSDAMIWICSYASLIDRPGRPLHDLCKTGWAGTDKRMYFSWHSAARCTDAACEGLSGEERANPSRFSWQDQGYLEQQKARLPSHQYRRLHLNLGGSPDGCAYNAEIIENAIDRSVKVRPSVEGLSYQAFVDMSGGSNDNACLAVAHKADGRAVLDLLIDQGQRTPFDPLAAVKRFAAVLKGYRVHTVTGDNYAGETFKSAFEKEGIAYRVSDLTKHEIYEAFEPRLNASQVLLLDQPTMESELIGLVWRGARIDHMPGEHDDYANAAAGVVNLILDRPTFTIADIVTVQCDLKRESARRWADYDSLMGRDDIFD